MMPKLKKYTYSKYYFSSVQLLSRVQLFQPHGLQHARSPYPSPAPGVLKLMSVESVVPSNHLILCCPLPLLPSIFPSIRVGLL